MTEYKRIAVEDLVDGETYEKYEIITDNKTIKVSEVTLINCIFSSENLDHSEWLDCKFKTQSFANLDLSNSLFYRCQFTDCNLLGTNFLSNSWKNVGLKNCRVDYANFSGSKMDKCIFKNSSFKETFFDDVDFNNKLETSDCEFTETSFIDTKMKGVDLSESEIEDIRVMPEDTTGLEINQFQAVNLVSLFGIKIK